MIKLVEIYKKKLVAKHGYGYGQSVEENKYCLREVYCNEDTISTMRQWSPPEGSTLPEGLDSRQNFTSIEMSSGAAYKTLFIVKDIAHLSKEIQDNIL